MLKENHHDALRQSETQWLGAGPTEMQWDKKPRRSFGENAFKNLAVASALVLCAVVLRSGTFPALNETTDAVLTAVTGDTLLDDSLGKLSFVSSLFPEAVLVFGESHSGELALPVSGGTVVHAWHKDEPYTAWSTEDRAVYAAMDGEVIGVYHGLEEERLVQLMGANGLSCLYGSLGEVCVSTGDRVRKGELLGHILPGTECVLEVRRDGYSVDPAGMMDGAQ